MLSENRAVRIPSFEYSHCAIKSRLTSKSYFWLQYSLDKADLTPRHPSAGRRLELQWGGGAGGEVNRTMLTLASASNCEIQGLDRNSECACSSICQISLSFDILHPCQYSSTSLPELKFRANSSSPLKWTNINFLRVCYKYLSCSPLHKVG